MGNADLTVRIASEPQALLWDSAAPHPLQSWAWGIFRQRMGIDVLRLATWRGQSIVSTWQTTFHRIPMTGWSIGYMPKSITPSADVLSVLTSEARKRHAVSIQLEPMVEARNWHPESDTLKLLRPAHRPLFTKFTFSLDLTKTEQQLLADMHPKTRYNIRVAEKHGVTIRQDDNPQAFEDYLKLAAETTSRQKFFAHNENYQRTMWSVMKDAGIASLWTAAYNKQILAAWIIFSWQDAIYYPYGASSRDHREVMAPTLLLWEIAKWAKQQGKKTFDLWGAMGPHPDQNDPFYGFHRFKEGFRPREVEFAGSFDVITNPIGYRLFTAADKIRWNLLNLRRSI